MTKTREWLLLNAVESWLYHYDSPNTPTVEQYKQLRDELHDAYMASKQPKDAPTDDPPKRTTRKRNTSAKTV